MKDTISETAIDLFRQYGYNNVSVSQICKEAGVARSSFYSKYKSKDDIILHIYSDEFLTSQGLIEEFAKEKNDFERISTIYNHYINLAITLGPAVTASILIVELNNHVGIYEKISIVRDWNVALCRNCQELGIINNQADAESLIAITTATLNNMVFDWSRLEGDYPLQENARIALETILDLNPKYRTMDKNSTITLPEKEQ